MKKRFYTVILAFLITSQVFLPMAIPATMGIQIDMLLSQVRTNAGGSLSGGRVYFYAAGTSTPKDVYLDINKNTAAANPYTLDSNGTAYLFGDGLYRIVIKTAAGVTAYDRDNIRYEDLIRGASGTPDNTTYLRGDNSWYKLPRYFSTDAFTDNLTLYGNDLITKGPWVDVRAGYGAVVGAACNGTTEDNVALQAIITAIPNGTKLLFPGVCKVTGELNFSGKSYLTLEGLSWSNDGTPVTASGIQFTGNGARSALWLVGASYMTIRNLEISTSATNPPQVVLALGRKDGGSYGWHLFDHIRITGYATKALVYSIASEVNTWETPSLQMLGGGGKYAFYTAQSDNLAVSPGNFQGSTNLSLFMNNFWVWNLVNDNNAASIYIEGGGSSGDMYFRNGSGASANGAHFQINVNADGIEIAQGPFIFDSIRMELSTTTPKYGIRVTRGAGTTTPTVLALQTANLNFDATDALIYADTGIVMNGFSGYNLKGSPGSSAYSLDVDILTRGVLFATNNYGVRIRSASYGNFFTQVGAVTLPSATFNTFVQGDYATNGIAYTGPITQDFRYLGTDNSYFQRFYGNAADNATTNITTTVGDNTAVGPKSIGVNKGWGFVGMIRQNINGTDYWMPYYSWTTP